MLNLRYITYLTKLLTQNMCDIAGSYMYIFYVHNFVSNDNNKIAYIVIYKLTYEIACGIASVIYIIYYCYFITC